MRLPTPCWILGDAHLGAAPASAERDLLSLLAAAPERAGSLVVNGDLFEFWFEWRHVIPRTGYRAVAALAAASEAGLPVVFIGGNHDCWGGEALARGSGVQYVLGAWDGEIGSARVRIEHGDGLRVREDRWYRRVRGILRAPWSRWAYRLLHPDLGVALARATSHTSRETRPRDGGAGLRAVALKTLDARPELDAVVFGHSHVATLERTERGGVFANAGPWMDSPTFLTIDAGTIALRRWDGSAEGHCLDAINLGAKKPLP